MKLELKTIRMRTKILLIILLSVLSLSSINAQKGNAKIIITGTVLDASQNPVVNGIVMIDGKNTSYMTNEKGNYKIKVKRDAKTIGIVSFGNGMIEEAINDRVLIDFKYGTSASRLQEDQTIPQGEEGVNTGYNFKKKKDITSPVKQIDGTDRKYASYTSVYEMITREVGGVRINGSSIIIQGAKDFFGDVPALLIVDGVPVDNFNDISPSSVETISVLKGSSAAIYGSRAYGGAVVVTTKKQNK